MIDINEYTNSELEEMGFPPPCECLNTYTEETIHGDTYTVCEDCGTSATVCEDCGTSALVERRSPL